MTTEEIKQGDVVQLKSGGPTMTVETVAEDLLELTAFCTWFDKNNVLQSGKFQVTSLKKSQAPGPALFRVG